MRGVDEWGALLPGQRIAGYEIRSKLGQGGFGIAYDAFNADIQLRAAIKEFFPRDMVARSGTAVTVRDGESKGFYERFLGRFVEEARAVAKLRHPNIVSVRHFERANNTAYLVMDFIDGINLKAWLDARRGQLSEQSLRDVFSPVMDALAYVHSRNMLHRDVSPMNIMVDRTGKPWLIDFGAFKDTWREQPRRTSLLAANPAYAPPEQSDAMEGQEHGPFTDVFALAATMYEAFSGRKPSPAGARTAAVATGRPDPLVPLGQVGAVQCSPAVAAAIMSALALRAEARPQSMAALGAQMGWGPATMAAEARAVAATIPLPPAPPPRPAVVSLPAPHFPPQAVAVDARPRTARGGRIAAALFAVAIVAAGGVWFLRGPVFDRMAEAEFAAIATSSDPAELEIFARKHPGTRAGQKAEQLAVDLRRQRAAVEIERQKQARLAAATAEWQRLKSGRDETAIERFIKDNADSPHIADARSRLEALKADRARIDRLQAAARRWETLSTSTDEAAIERFIADYPDAPAAAAARSRLASVRAEKARAETAAAEWSRIRSTDEESVLVRFIGTHGDSAQAREARQRLDQLRQRRAAFEQEAEREWLKLLLVEDDAAIVRFIAAYPNTPSAKEAESRLSVIRKQKAAAAEAERERSARIQQAATEWIAIAASTDEPILRKFAERYADTPYAAEAKARLASLAAEREKVALAAWNARNEQATAEWNKIKGAANEKQVQRFIADHADLPVFPSVTEAKARLVSLKAEREKAEKEAEARQAKLKREQATERQEQARKPKEQVERKAAPTEPKESNRTDQRSTVNCIGYRGASHRPECQ